MSETQRIIDECTNCKACVKNCVFLEQFCQTPVELAKQFAAGLDEDEAYIPYLCTLCGLCETLCPKKLSCAKMCLEERQSLVKADLGPLPTHAPVVEDQKYVRSREFILEFPDPITGKSERVFMPGCHLTEYSPELVVSTYDWLIHQYPNTGFFFHCCAAPTQAMGKQAEFEEMGAELIAAAKKMGAGEIIVACPNCRKTVASYAGDIAVKTVYQLMAESDSLRPANGAGQAFVLHDPCAGRADTATHASVRELLSKLGFALEEFKNHGKRTTCCGMGGMVGYVSMDMANAVKEDRLSQAQSEIVTYCASCREAFADMRSSVHILDLVFDPDWEEKKKRAPLKMSQKHDNLVFLRRMVKEKYALP